jgi:threonine dehydratase
VSTQLSSTRTADRRFKVRGGWSISTGQRERPKYTDVTATRGNHGQSLAFAGARAAVPVTIVVPHGNSTDKNDAMRALGAELIEHGRDFDEAKEHAVHIAAERGRELAPSFHRDFVVGVATYAHELFTAESEIDTVYVPIGLGSGICGLIGTRDLLGHKTKIVGVVSDRANTYRLSVEAGCAVPTNSAATFADGMAVRVPDATALRSSARAERIVEVSDDEIAEAMRLLHRAAHLRRGAGRPPGGADEGTRPAAGPAGRGDRVQNIDWRGSRPCWQGHAAGRMRTATSAKFTSSTNCPNLQRGCDWTPRPPRYNAIASADLGCSWQKSRRSWRPPSLLEGYPKPSLVSCPIALYPASSSSGGIVQPHQHQDRQPPQAADGRRRNWRAGRKDDIGRATNTPGPVHHG